MPYSPISLSTVRCLTILQVYFDNLSILIMLEKYSKSTKREGRKLVRLDEAFSCDSKNLCPMSILWLEMLNLMKNLGLTYLEMASKELGTLPRITEGRGRALPVSNILTCHHTASHQVIPEAFTCSLLFGRSWAKVCASQMCWVLSQSPYALDVYYYEIKVGIYNALVKQYCLNNIHQL